jgi:hypothetical protein
MPFSLHALKKYTYADVAPMMQIGAPLLSDSRRASTRRFTSTPVRPTRNMLSGVPKC